MFQHNLIALPALSGGIFPIALQSFLLTEWFLCLHFVPLRCKRKMSRFSASLQPPTPIHFMALGGHPKRVYQTVTWWFPSPCDGHRHVLLGCASLILSDRIGPCPCGRPFSSPVSIACPPDHTTRPLAVAGELVKT